MDSNGNVGLHGIAPTLLTNGQIMFRSANISDEVRQQIRCRAAELASERDVPQTIFQTLLDAQIDPATVSLDQYKSILVDAVRSARRLPERGTTAC